jgi:hypothetical protein
VAPDIAALRPLLQRFQALPPPDFALRLPRPLIALVLLHFLSLTIVPNVHHQFHIDKGSFKSLGPAYSQNESLRYEKGGEFDEWGST